MGYRILTPNESFLTFRAPNVCAKFHQNRTKIATVGVQTLLNTDKGQYKALDITSLKYKANLACKLRQTRMVHSNHQQQKRYASKRGTRYDAAPRRLSWQQNNLNEDRIIMNHNEDRNRSSVTVYV